MRVGRAARRGLLPGRGAPRGASTRGPSASTSARSRSRALLPLGHPLAGRGPLGSRDLAGRDLGRAVARGPDRARLRGGRLHARDPLRLARPARQPRPRRRRARGRRSARPSSPRSSPGSRSSRARRAEPRIVYASCRERRDAAAARLARRCDARGVVDRAYASPRPTRAVRAIRRYQPPSRPLHEVDGTRGTIHEQWRLRRLRVLTAEATLHDQHFATAPPPRQPVDGRRIRDSLAAVASQRLDGMPRASSSPASSERIDSTGLAQRRAASSAAASSAASSAAARLVRAGRSRSRRSARPRRSTRRARARRAARSIAGARGDARPAIALQVVERAQRPTSGAIAGGRSRCARRSRPVAVEVGQVTATSSELSGSPGWPAPASLTAMAAPSASQPTPQRLASIREQVSLLADYL